jgi:hypothetical protein
MPDLRRLVHPVDLLVFALAVILAVIAYAYLFRSSPVSTSVDPLFGARLVVEFDDDRPWKSAFPETDDRRLQLDAYLMLRALGPSEPSPERPLRRRLELEILGRDAQRVEALERFRDGVRRGAVVTLSALRSEVRAEVMSVRLRGDDE